MTLASQPKSAKPIKSFLEE